MPLSRRQLLIGGAGALALASCSSGGSKRSAAPTTATAAPVSVPTTEAVAHELLVSPFTLGVASGDPDSTSVVLWTRLLGNLPASQPVIWELASDESFTTLVAADVATATDVDAHTLHVVADGLEPDTWYWYRFTAGRFTSTVGRARTTPADGASPKKMRFGFASCQSWTDGYYTAHAGLAKEDVDLVVWLGDYIYEGGLDPKAVRNHDGPEPMTLDAYRNRYSLYKSDPHLQAAHARAPWFVIWDDHEVENNYAGDSSEDHAPVAAFNARRAAAYKAWWEHQPTRLPKPDGFALVTYRPLQWGSLATFFGLDGRQYRDDQPCDRSSDLGESCPDREVPTRTMLGAEQEAWLAKSMPASTSTWNVVANQTIFSPSGIPVGSSTIYNLDQWDGYPAARDRMLDVLAKTTNPVIITGDIHASAVADFKRGDTVIGTELVGTSITSDFPAVFVDIFESAAKAVGTKMADARHHGYVVCELTKASFHADYRNVDSALLPSSPVATASSWVITAGKPGVASA